MAVAAIPLLAAAAQSGQEDSGINFSKAASGGGQQFSGQDALGGGFDISQLLQTPGIAPPGTNQGQPPLQPQPEESDSSSLFSSLAKLIQR